MNEEKEKIVAYVTRVSGTWFAISMVEKHMYAFEVGTEEFAEYAVENGIELLFDELPVEVYKCFTATFLVIAEHFAKEEEA